ncbi:MAG: transketolase [Phycisphaerae bacterium]|nr:transketolase [Phycisphaerae bacterium]
MIQTTDANRGPIEQLCVEAISLLAVDAVQKANSGHPGMPMGMAATAFELWDKFLKHNPLNPQWLNRDRFVLSAGHGSMLHYALLHLAGYDIALDDLKDFRQWDSITPGHPEYRMTPGIEATTGPLGQGVANCVGMAIAQKHLATRFNKENFPIFDYNIYTIAGDGCMQEGITSEACSLAGHLGLDNLVVLYDDNHITIDGATDLSFTEDVAKRYEAYGWHVQFVDGDGQDRAAINKAIEKALAHKGQPSLIKIRSEIGFGSPNKQGTHDSHGAPLGAEEIKLTKKAMGWDPEKSFYVPEEVYQLTRQARDKGQDAMCKWMDLFDAYAKEYPQLADEIDSMTAGRLPKDIDEMMPKYKVGDSVATRKVSGAVINAVMPKLSFYMGGSADLTPSNCTHFDGVEDFQKDNYAGRYIRYGVREHAMGAIMNGICVSNLLRAYSATFLSFADYMRPAIRMAALSNYNTTFVFTHDSIGVGEDGPTHQPVEILGSLRIIPDLTVLRPADANETVAAWKWILENNDKPAVILLTRQNLPVLEGTAAMQVQKGAYALNEVAKPDVILIGTGSEVQLAVDAAAQLAKDGIQARVISMPSWELFEAQPQNYRNALLPKGAKYVAVEAATEQGWHKYIGSDGEFVGMMGFGASAPADICFEKFGITTENVVKAAKKVFRKK